LTTTGPFTAGQSITYTIVVANAGPSAATNIQVTDTPTDLTITNVSGGGCAVLPFTIASLASGANTTITVTATIVAAGAFDNSATATAADARRLRDRDGTGCPDRDPHTIARKVGAMKSAAAARIDPSWAACERFEAALDCQTCGACCREAYHSVEVAPRDPAIKKQPDYIVHRGSYPGVKRCGPRCSALAGGAVEDGATTRYHCVIYDDRPRTCREFTLGSEHCLTARRRVGLAL